MIIGIPKEIKSFEYRVGATPAMVHAFVEHGHKVLVEKSAGERVGFSDAMFEDAGAEIVKSHAEVFNSELVVKVKEPEEAEFPYLYEGQILFCFLHLAPNPALTKTLIESKIIGIAYETVTDAAGKLPLLIPMSQIAGRLSIQAGAVTLQMNHGGKGVLLGGVPGVIPSNVVILGGGVAGTEAARMAMGLGANATILDKNLTRLRELDSLYGPALKTLYATPAEIETSLPSADLVIGAILVPGKTAPKIITREIVKSMSPGSVIVDVSIDQGGCAETSRPTTFGDPTFVKEKVIHYCVANLPGSCARTSTYSLTNATMEYILEIANKGYRQALLSNEGLRQGLNVCFGQVTNPHVAQDLNYPYSPPEEVL
ncbi:MAG: alanine dehydrogenase [Waddliaceae bacterium]